MFKKHNQIPLKIGNMSEHLLCIEGGFIYCDEKKIWQFDIYNNSHRELCTAENPLLLKKINTELFFIDNWHSLALYDFYKEEKEIFFKEGFEFMFLLLNKSANYYHKTSSQNIISLVHYYDNKVFWSQNNLSGVLVIENFLITLNNNFISSISENDGQILWRFDVSEIDKELEVSRLVGIWNGILVAGIGEDYMIGINTENGEMVWKIETDIASHAIIDKENSKLKCIISRYYFEIELGNGNYRKIQYAETDDDFDSQRNNYVLVGDHIITTDWKKGKIGAFNTLTHRFDWIHEEPGVSFPAGQAMKYFDPFLFVMDSKEVLHIFKKE